VAKFGDHWVSAVTGFQIADLKALLAAKATRAELNYEALPDYLANHVPSGTATLFVGVQQLLPGHTLRWRDGALEIRQYWDLSFADSKDAHRTDTDLIAEFGERFTCNSLKDLVRTLFKEHPQLLVVINPFGMLVKEL